jgi:putative ABC transport system permease protein
MNLTFHYILIAYRNILKEKSFSLINISGLALGMACCILIMSWIEDEQNIDNFHTKGDRLYNLYETVTTNGEVSGSYATTIRRKEDKIDVPIADIPQAIPEVMAVNFYATGYELPWGYPETFQVGEKKQKFEGSRTGPDFFEMFDYEVLAGQRDDALADLASIAISRKMAEYFFKTPSDAIGKIIRYENRIDFSVTTVSRICQRRVRLNLISSSIGILT